ncbi:hypothetical protein GCM10007036_37080 [Alsobacter metallidurans]|uniref:histidine kinase n=1 Tax=Alsobacter metallidurans TaxID=340221 RepID=A0A917MIV6_9HYPH|nr:ATP-binding protein [Alsobacter metallidurans]GGH28081.1 hypothetical protein GCM10007036_37080 [Alsobacter metallidurans]
MGTGNANSSRKSATLGSITGVMGLFGLALILISFLLLATELRRQMRRDAIGELQSQAFLLSDHAGRLIEVVDVALRSATAAVGQRELASLEGDKALFEQLKALTSALPYVEDIWLNDAAGLLRFTTFAMPAPYSNAADRDAFKALASGGDALFIGERILGRVTGQPTFLLARRLSRPDGGFAGMVSATAELSYFGDYWKQIPLPYDARVTLRRAPSLDVLDRYPAIAEYVGAQPPSVMQAAISASPEAGVMGEYQGADGTLRFGAYRRVGDKPVYVSVTVSEAALHAAWRDRVTIYGVYAATAWLAFGALSILGFRQAGREAKGKQALEQAQTDLAAVNVSLERTIAERTRELRESEGQLRLILESATDSAIISTDLTGVIRTWNVGAEAVLGWTAAEATGRHFRIIFTPEDRAASVPDRELGQALADGRASDDRWMVRRDGERFFATGALLPMRGGEGGAPSGFLKILRDRTREFEVEEAKRSLNETLEQLVQARTRELESANAQLVAEAASRQRAEEQLRQSQKMEALGRLTGGVAHDFNNLLTVVTGNLDMLGRCLAPGEDARAKRLLGQAVEGADRAAALTQRLLAFSRQQPLAPEPVDVNRLVAGMSDLLERTLGENIAIETVLAGGLWRTHADPNQLENAVLNLAVNARDAMPDGGKLTIETVNSHLDESYMAGREEIAPGQYVMIAVCDTGAGMAADVVAKAFEPFYTTKAIGKGTGLGLSQVYGFAKQSNGHTAIYSEPGQGTTVKIYLPRYRAVGERASLPEPQNAAEVALGAGETILVVEDEMLVRNFSVAALEDAGYRVLAAEDGPSGLALFDAHPEIDLLFTDVILTGPMNGRMVAKEALGRRPDLKVLFTTGYTRNAIVHHGRLDEGVQLLTKPFTATSLAAKVAAVLKGRG